jgi:hypothetical protein
VNAGLETMLQLAPSQCSTTAFEPVVSSPTAQALFEAGAVTPFRRVPVGLGTTLQLLPFQCSINELPTAHTSLLAAATTPEKKELLVGEGVGTTLQLVPLKCSANVCCPLEVEMRPTAQMSLAVIAAAPVSEPLLTCGLGTKTRPDSKLRSSRCSTCRGSWSARAPFAPRSQRANHHCIMIESSQVRSVRCTLCVILSLGNPRSARSKSRPVSVRSSLTACRPARLPFSVPLQGSATTSPPLMLAKARSVVLSMP